MNGRIKVLLVDENPHDRALAAVVLRQRLAGVEPEEVGDPVVFAERLARGEFAAVVSETRFSWGNGLKVLATVKSLHPDRPVVFFGGPGSESLVAEAIALGVDGLVMKSPSGFIQLAEVVGEALDRLEKKRISRAGEERYRTLVEGMPVGVFTAQGDGIIRDASPAAARVLGAARPETLIGESLPTLLGEKEPGEQLLSLMARGERVRNLEAPVRTSGREPAWVRINAWPVSDPARPDIRYEGSLEDISSYKRAEGQLAERAAALSRSNSELQQFSYVISHDLQEPLHLISRYTEIVAERYQGSFDAEGRRFLDHVITSATRMQTMINDVLEYSRVETRGRPFRPVPFARVVADAVANLKATIEETGGKVEWGALPTLLADSAQMTQLFQNLIGNAIKFRGVNPPCVQVSAVEAEDAWVFAVMDNGVGIEEEQLDRIFGLFQRLHAAHEVPGTGIGLAICKRIVERHGGQIWATSRPGEGSTFYFSLPKRQGESPGSQIDESHGGGHGVRTPARSAHRR
ncbi:MAG: sensor histidine kinase [Acidobacteriota bacterium]